MPKRAKEKAYLSNYRGIIQALIFSNTVSIVLFLLRMAESQSVRYWFLIWNLFLGWLPVLFAHWLVKCLGKYRWGSWQAIGLTILWLSFLPNSFYLATDLIHLRQTGEVSLLYDVVMLCSFIFNAFLAGYISVIAVHREIIKRFDKLKSNIIIAILFLACGFAIYLGRVLRWNSWDLVINPAGILFDVSDRLVRPSSHSPSFVIMITFFLLIFSTYMVIWEFIKFLSPNKN